MKSKNRGRPKKEFISKKSKVKRDKPGRPTKQEKIEERKIEQKNRDIFSKKVIPEENKFKDKVILLIFIFSLLLFGFSIYISQNKILSQISDISTTTGAQIFDSNISWWLIETGQISKPLSIPEQKVIEFYQYINNSQQKELYEITENSLKQSKIFQTYFSNTRLKRFVNNLDQQKIQININKTEIWTISNIDYTITYTLPNTTQTQKQYQEQRSATLVQKDWIYKFSRIMCITTWCSKMPFFNPGKYDIK